MSLRQLVQPPASRPLHGRVAYWKQQADRASGQISVEFERKRDGLTFRPAQLTVYVLSSSKERLTCSTENWNEEVNDDLISIGAKSTSVDNEVERLGYALQFKLEPAEIRYGDGYFNAVLIPLLCEEGFEEFPNVKRCLDKIHTHSPNGGVQFDDSRRDIKSALHAAGSSLTSLLGYDLTTAETILAGAVAYYLDERFHLTNRERLGFG